MSTVENDWSEQRSEESHDDWTRRLKLKELEDTAAANAAAW